MQRWLQAEEFCVGRLKVVFACSGWDQTPALPFDHNALLLLVSPRQLCVERQKDPAALANECSTSLSLNIRQDKLPIDRHLLVIKTFTRMEWANGGENRDGRFSIA